MAAKWIFVAPVSLALLCGALIGVSADTLLHAAAAAAKQDLKPAVSLPINRVVLFNSGVGYFSRSGEVVDDARVDLMFPDQDINDLLKSMVLEDKDGGRIAAVSYDSRDVSLARQKSAMLPIVGKSIEGQRVSIYNQFAQAKHPLLGLKFKNTTGLHLNQGPITVFEGSVFAGDTRVLDVGLSTAGRSTARS